MSKNKTAVVGNSLNTSSNNNGGLQGSTNIGNSNAGNGYLHANIGAVQKTQVSSTVGKAGLDSIMGQKLVGPKISTVKR